MATKIIYIDLTSLKIFPEKPTDAQITAMGREPSNVVYRRIETVGGDDARDWLGGIQGMIGARVGSATGVQAGLGISPTDAILECVITDSPTP